MNGKSIARAAVGLTVALAAVSMFVPWAAYGDIDIPLRRLPNWGLYPGAVLAFCAALTWLMLTPSGRRRPPLIVSSGTGVITLAATVAVALGYDNTSAIFSGAVPMVVPHLSFGPFTAAGAILAGLVATAAATIRRRSAVPGGRSTPVGTGNPVGTSNGAGGPR
nr:hypothetical protein [Micromonospora sp. DSM 115978]